VNSGFLFQPSAAGSSSGNANLAVVSKTTTYTVSILDELVLLDATSAAFTATLPTAVGNTGKVLRFKKIDSSSNIVTIDGNGSETIDGILTRKLGSQYDELTIASDGSNWVEISGGETISAKYTLGAGTGITTNTAIAYSSKSWDYNNNVSSGVFTATRPGLYLVTASIYIAAAVTIYIWKNGSSFKQGQLGSNGEPSQVDGYVRLAVGDTIDIRPDANGTTAGTSVLHTFEIARVGN
jgi:uncharacterized membrane protein